MPFLDYLFGYWMGRHGEFGLDREERRRQAARLWGLNETDLSEPKPAKLDYDRAHWIKKMRRILDELPRSEKEWEGLMIEARALGFDEEWAGLSQIEEFEWLVRRAVADCQFTEEERRKLNLARELIGMTVEEAEALVKTIVDEAEKFFGDKVKEP